MATPTPETSTPSEAIVLVKAFPQVGEKHGETVCVAGVTRDGNWVRLFPVTFRKLNDGDQFNRWDIIKFSWRKPRDDIRSESLRVDQNSIEIIGQIRPKDREALLSRIETKSTNQAAAEGKSLALIRPIGAPKLSVRKKTDDEISRETAAYNDVVKQTDMFDKRILKPIHPCPYTFTYKYVTEDGDREGTCQDWEIHATYFKWSKLYGDTKALSEMQRVFGEQYPKKGMLFAMGTHSRWKDTWLINGIIRADEFQQMHLPL